MSNRILALTTFLFRSLLPSRLVDKILLLILLFMLSCMTIQVNYMTYPNTVMKQFDVGDSKGIKEVDEKP